LPQSYDVVCQLGKLRNRKGCVMSDKDYVVVTCVSSYRMRYVMHKDDLQKLNTEKPVDPIEWANDTVTMEQCEEFSQEHMGEYILDTFEMTEDEVIELFDKDNDYLSSWPNEKKIESIRKALNND